MADQLIEYKCPCCGGKLEFNSSVQQMKCPYCDSEFSIEAMQANEEAMNAQDSDDMNWETPQETWSDAEAGGMKVYKCQSCGGEIVADETTSASACPYCDNPIVMTGQFKGDLKPDLIIPFKLDKEAAKAEYVKHLKGKFLLPKVFKDENHIDEIKGIYVPFWLFDSNADADIRFRATRVRTWSDSNYNYTQTSYFSVYRAGYIGFDHVPVDGSTRMADDLMESVEPFNFADAVDFQTAYLSGYFADKYDVTAEQSIGRANERIKTSTEDAFRDTVKGYATVTPEYSSVRLHDGKTKYAFYPVWLLNTTYKDEKFTFAMNGQTGKFVGNLPTDKGKFWKFAALFTVIAGAVIYGGMWLAQLL